MPRHEFTRKTRRLAYEAANGICVTCRLRPVSEYDHIVADAIGGDNTLSNCAAVCFKCHKIKTKDDVRVVAKSNRIRDKRIGALRSKRPMPFGKGSRLKKKIGGQIVDRRSGRPV